MNFALTCPQGVDRARSGKPSSLVGPVGFSGRLEVQQKKPNGASVN